MSDRLAADRPTTIRILSTRTRRFTIGAAIPAVLIGVLGSTYSDAPKDSGLVACAYPLTTQDVPATAYQQIRAEFAGSRWPGLRNAGTAYVDLAIKLLRPPVHRWIRDRLALPAAGCRVRKARKGAEGRHRPIKGKNTMSHIRWAFVLTVAAAMAAMVAVAASAFRGAQTATRPSTNGPAHPGQSPARRPQAPGGACGRRAQVPYLWCPVTLAARPAPYGQQNGSITSP